MKRIIIYMALGFSVVVAGLIPTLNFYDDDNESNQLVKETELYTCGMHPEIVQSEPGNCPLCGMTLTLIPTASAATISTIQQDEKKERKIKYWVAPMDPFYISDEPGKSPMGMDLVPVYEDGMGDGNSGPVIRIDPVTVQNTGIRTELIRRQNMGKEIRTVGLVDYDETRYTHIHTKVRGWIEKLYVDYTGQKVLKDQPLLDIYSPELVSTQEEYLSTFTNMNTKNVGTMALLRSTKERLFNWDITPEQISELENTGKVSKVMTLYSPFNGIVVEKMALKGMNVMEGMSLYSIADLSKVWVYADIYEYELPWLEEDLKADMTLTYIPGKVFRGSVAFVYPYLDSKTRTIKVRLEFDNVDGQLRPGMYANIVIETAEKKEVIVVPKESVIHSGERDLVFVSLGEGKFEPREIILGVEGGSGYYEVLEGLNENEIVVVSGQFLLDSESSLREAILKRLRAKDNSSGKMEMN